MSLQTITYAQRYEDLHLLRCFGEQARGFYIDIGAGHPVYDSVSFAFYQRGWRGVAVEPNPWLARLSEAVRPDDANIACLVGAISGEATYYLIEDFHGLSTTIESQARATFAEYGKRAQEMHLPVTTLAALCERHAPAEIDFLKIDVEGAEHDVLRGGDWNRFRPKVVLAEALEQITLEQSWPVWDELLRQNGYRYAFFDTLNRYYVAEEHEALAEWLNAAHSFEDVAQFGNFQPAAGDPAHPDHALARLLDGLDMVKLPLLPVEALLKRLTAGLGGSLDRAANAADIDEAHRRIFGAPPGPSWNESLALGSAATVRDLYRSAVVTPAFRIACGRISASSAW